MKPGAVSSAPEFQIHPIEASDLAPTPTITSNTTYTLVLTDPDATSRSDPVKAEMCHWIVTGISLCPKSTEDGQRYRTVSVDRLSLAGDTNVSEVMSYYPPAPPPKTGYHRYVFVLLAPNVQHGKKAPVRDIKKPNERPHWGYGKVGKGVMDWAEDNRLMPVGESGANITDRTREH